MKTKALRPYETSGSTRPAAQRRVVPDVSKDACQAVHKQFYLDYLKTEDESITI